MGAASLTPTQPAHEAEARDAFLALMWALSYPGREQRVPGAATTEAAMRAIGHALLDLETSYYADDGALGQALARSGARAKPIADASYVFFPTLAAKQLALLSEVSRGTFDYPDGGATLVIGCDLADAAPAVCLRGPGILGEQQIRVAGLPDGFWEARERLIHYPLGIDVFLVSGARVLGLPRTTQVQTCM